MTDLRQRLRPLVEDSGAAAPPMADLQRRARRLRRRRWAGRSVAGAVVVMALVLVLPGMRTVWQPPPGVMLAPGAEHARPVQVYEGDGVRFSYPGDWTVVADPPGPEVLVGTQPLSELDTVLALLTRHDSVFSDALPDTGVFFAVGGDRLQPVYDSEVISRRTVGQPHWWPEDQLPDGPAELLEVELEATAGPDDRLGDPRMLHTEDGGEVIARFGHVGSSTVNFAVYATGPGASEAALAADEIVATLSYRAEVGSAPPTGEPYFPHGRERTVDDAVDPVVTLEYGDVQLGLRVGSDCLLVSQVQQGSDQPLAGRCDLVTPGRFEFASALVEGLETAPPRRAPVEEPGDERTQSPDVAVPTPATGTLAAAGVGDGITSAEVRAADGQTSSAAVQGGWLLAAAPGRIVQIIGFDKGGAEVATVTTP